MVIMCGYYVWLLCVVIMCVICTEVQKAVEEIKEFGKSTLKTQQSVRKAVKKGLYVEGEGRG